MRQALKLADHSIRDKPKKAPHVRGSFVVSDGRRLFRAGHRFLFLFHAFLHFFFRLQALVLSRRTT